jgi:hypothetical protein
MGSAKALQKANISEQVIQNTLPQVERGIENQYVCCIGRY